MPGRRKIFPSNTPAGQHIMSIIPITTAAGYNPKTIDSLILPIAPQAVFRTRYAPEGKAAPALLPAEALAELEQHPAAAAIELDGPGDPLATLETTLDVLARLKERRPDLPVHLTTLGLGGAAAAPALAEAGLDGVTLLIDTMDPATADKLYAWIRPGKRTVPLAESVELLLEQQAGSVRALAEAGIPVTLRTTLYPGLNAHQAVTIAETMSELGATAMVLRPFAGSSEKNSPPATTRTHMEQISRLTGRSLPTTFPEIAVENCGCDCGPVCGSGTTCGCSAAPVLPGTLPRPTAARPRVAVASATGMEVDLHLGQAKTLLIYGPREDGLTCLIETRPAPEPGSGEDRWDRLAETLNDCFALLAAAAGERPRQLLAEQGIRVLLTEDNIEGTVDVLYGGGKKGKCK